MSDAEYRAEQIAAVAREMARLDLVNVVRCMDCVHYYEAEEYHPQGNYDKRCCKYFDTYDDEVEPYGFCAWGESK